MYIDQLKLTDWFLDDNFSGRLHERSDANSVLCRHSKEIGLPIGEPMSNSIGSAGRERHRGPGLPLCFPLFYNIVTDGGTTVILREEPVQLARVAAQVLSCEGNANRSWDI